MVVCGSGAFFDAEPFRGIIFSAAVPKQAPFESQMASIVIALEKRFKQFLPPILCMLLGISTGSIWRCSESRLGSVHLVEEKFGGLIDGIELCFIEWNEFSEFELDERAKRFLGQLRFVSLHAPCSGIEYGNNRKNKAGIWENKGNKQGGCTAARDLPPEPCARF